MNEELDIEEEKLRLSHNWAIINIIFACIAIAFLTALDYFATPENYSTFLFYRIVTIMLYSPLLISFYFMKLKSKLHVYVSIIYGAAITSGMVEVMIMDFGAHQSPYYAGFIIIGMYGLGLTPLFSKSVAIIIGSLIYFIYLVPLILLDNISNVNIFMNNNIFLFVSLVSAVLWRIYMDSILLNKIRLEYELKNYSSHLEELVDQKSRQLLDSEKMKSLGVISSGLAHDFRNVLSTIKGFIQFILMKRAIDPDINDGIRIVDGEIARGSFIVDKLMKFARKIDLNKKKCSIRELVHDAMDTMIKIVPETVRLDVNIDESMSTFMVDPYYFDQVLKNLVINAIDAMPDGGRISIIASIATPEEIVNLDEKRIYSELIKVGISDTGKGISKEDLPYVFDPFYTTKEQGQGSGLGLAMVYGIVKEHNGYITVDSREGEGTTFTIYLPVSFD